VPDFVAFAIGFGWMLLSGRLHRHETRRFALTLDETRPISVVAPEEFSDEATFVARNHAWHGFWAGCGFSRGWRGARVLPQRGPARVSAGPAQGGFSPRMWFLACGGCARKAP
jgi:hypothetical protein